MTLQVTISARKLSWPDVCACCMGYSDAWLRCAHSVSKGRRVVHTTTKAWSVPYCRRCIRHRRLHLSAGWWWRAGLVLGGGLLLCALLAREGTPWLLMSALAFVACALRGRSLAGASRRAMAAACRVPGSAVVYHGWHGSEQTFEFANQQYYVLFLDSNDTKRRSATRRGSGITQ
jgi:hypothetical protein